MGVRGLQTFLKNNPTLSQNIILNNTSLVIDANNLLCTLFCTSCNQQDSECWRSDIYGGDYVFYGQVVKDFFTKLDQCSIEPILVFDGSVIGKKSTQHELALKEKEIHRRCLDKFQAAKNMSETAPDERIVMSRMNIMTFKSIVLDMGIQCIQTPYEADSHIARIANDLNCPVLTNDSDFLIYFLPQGFIMIDQFSYKNPTNNHKGCGIPCTIYSQLLLVKSIPGLRSECMPLLSVLLGNDYVESGTFDPVIKPICNQHYSGLLVASSWTSRRIVNLLIWLRGKTLSESIEFVTDQLHHSLKAKIKSIIKTLLNNYQIESTDNFEAELNQIYPPRKSNFQASDQDKLVPSSYIRRLLETKNMSPMILDIVFKNTHYNYSLIDDINMISSSFVGFRPLSLSIALLRSSSSSGLTTNSRIQQEEKDTFYIFDRIREEYIRTSIKPMAELEGFGSLLHIDCYSSITMDQALKKSMLFAVFRFNDEEFHLMIDVVSQIFTSSFIHETALCFMLLKYIGLETKCPPKRQFIDAMTLTLFYYATLEGQIMMNSLSEAHVGKLLLRLRPHTIRNNKIEYVPSQEMYRRICHFISQLIHAYSAYDVVNGLLDQIFYNPRTEKFFNGTMIFRLTKLLRLGALNIDNLCDGLSPLLSACSTIKVMVNCD